MGLRNGLSAAKKQAATARMNQIQKILRDWKHEHTSRAMEAWVQALAAARAQVEASWNAKLQEFVAEAFLVWVLSTSGQQHRHDAMRRVTGRWRHRLLSGVFFGWQEAATAQVADRKNKLGLAAQWWRLRQVAFVFLPWIEFCHSATRYREIAVHIASRRGYL
jgi:hypothetical protein